MTRHVGLIVVLLSSFALSCAQARPQALPDEVRGSTPRYGGTVNLMVTEDPDDWDITYAGSSQPNNFGIGQAYSGLLGVKAGPEIGFNDLILQPELAERWQVSPDARTFTFFLRKGVKYADRPPVSGREFIAADVKWSFEYSSRTGPFRDSKLPPAQFGYFFAGMEGIETPDANTVVVRMKDPVAPFLNYVASDSTPILPHEIFDKEGNFKESIAGTGPYQIDPSASQKGTRWVWQKNPTYWEPGKPYLDTIRWLVLPETATIYAAFQTKQIDYIGGGKSYAPLWNGAQQIMSANPDAIVIEALRPGPLQFYVNSRKAPLNDLRVRKAIALSLDRDELIRVVAGKGEWAMAGAPAGLFTNQEIRQMLRHDPGEAKRLLAEAGFPDGLDLEFMIGQASDDVTTGELFEAQLRKAGIRLALKPTDGSTSSRNRRAGNFTLNFTAGATLVGDPANWMYAGYHPESSQNYQGVNDPKLRGLDMRGHAAPSEWCTATS